MFHPDTQFLIDHWTGLAARRGALGGVPDRASLKPDLLGLRLPRTFIAERREGEVRLRLVGGWIESLHRARLTAETLPSLWRADSRAMIEAALQRTMDETAPVVINAAVGAAGSSLEITLAPLRSASGRVDRILGLYAPLSSLTLTKDESRQLTGRFARTARSLGRPPLSLAAIDGRRVA